MRQIRGRNVLGKRWCPPAALTVWNRVGQVVPEARRLDLAPGTAVPVHDDDAVDPGLALDECLYPDVTCGECVDRRDAYPGFAGGLGQHGTDGLVLHPCGPVPCGHHW